MDVMPSFRVSLALIAAAGIGLAAQTVTKEPAGPKSAPAVPVVIELFTSEGCSSCPPADDLMAMLERDQPVKGAWIIALGEHVDYWDRLGWRDQFSSAQFTARQNDYAQAFRSDDIYTPQLIVNGAEQVVGSDARKVTAAIAKAAATQPRLTLALTFPNVTAADVKRLAQIPVQVRATLAAGAKLDEPVEVLIAVTEKGLGSHVIRGENSGRDLRHGPVLRTLIPIGTMAAKDGSWSATHPLPLAKDWTPRQASVVALAQGQKSRRILGVSVQALDGADQVPATGSR
jgi:hypothetical protein